MKQLVWQESSQSIVATYSLPDWLRLDPASGYLVGYLPSNLTPRRFNFTVRASDGDFFVEQNFSIIRNRKPLMKYSFESKFTDTQGTIWVSDDFELDLAPFFEDPDNDKYRIAVAQQNNSMIPAWLAIKDTLLFG